MIIGLIDELLGLLALVWIIAVVAVPIIAGRKRLAAWPWLVLTMVFGPFALLAVLIVPEPERGQYPASSGRALSRRTP